MTHSTKAFSLVELSIVLVILGLLVGGVLSGQSLIRAAELRSVSTDFQRYSAAVFTFRDKYFALPGDMPNATQFWGVAGGTGSNAACSNTVSTTTATCNGNGNGETSGTWVAYDENYFAWKHLANAGLVEGSYAGSYNGLTPADVLTRLVPRAKISNAGIMFWREPLSDQGWSGGDSANTRSFIRLAAVYMGVDAPPRVGSVVLRPEEAWNIDTKMDDGVPGTGSLTVYAGTGCGTTSVVSTSVYALTNNSILCIIDYRYAN